MRHVHRFVLIGLFIVFASSLSITVYADQRPGDCTGLCSLVWSPADAHLLGAVDQFGLWFYDTNQSDSPPQFFPQAYATSLSFDPLGRYVAVLSCPGFTAVPTDRCHGLISLFDLKTQSWTELGAYDFPISLVKFTPDGRYVAFQKDEPRAWGIELIDLATDETISIVDRGFTSVISNYAFDPQTNYIAISNGAFGTEGDAFWGISLWRLSDQTLQAHTEQSRTVEGILAPDLTFMGTETDITFVQYNTQVSVWNYNTGVISSLKKLNETVGDNLHRLSFSDPPTYLLAALVDWLPISHRRLFAWNLQSGEKIFYRDTPEDSYTDLIALNSTGDYIAYSSTVDPHKIVTIWDRSTNSTSTVTLLH